MNNKVKDWLYLIICGLVCFFIGVFLGWCIWAKELMNIMGMMDLCNKEIIDIFVNFANIACGIVAIFALFFSVSSYKQSAKNERRNNTITELREIEKTFFHDKDLFKDDSKTTSYLNELELLATGIKLNIYDLEVIYIHSGHIFVSEYKIWLKTFIEKSRKETGCESDYCEFESMILNLEEMQKVKK